jgi:hypothetical protein
MFWLKSALKLNSQLRSLSYARRLQGKPGQQVLVAFDFSCWFCHA